MSGGRGGFFGGFYNTIDYLPLHIEIIHMRNRFLLVGLWLAATTAAYSSTLAFWDFNDNTLGRSQGDSGTLSAHIAGHELIAYQNYGVGTDLNALAGVPAGSALRFFDLATLGVGITVQIDGLNSTGYEDLIFSFALRHDQIGLHFFDTFVVEYNVDGSWNHVANVDHPLGHFTTRTINLTDILELNDNPDFGLRIHFVEYANLIDIVKFDNILISAIPIPEASSLAWAGALALFGGILIVRRRTRRNSASL